VLAEREVANLVRPVLGSTALDDEDQILDGCSNGHRLRDSDDARHRQPHSDPLDRSADQRGDIVGEEHAPFGSGASEDGDVICAAETDVLHADGVDVSEAPQKAAQDVIV
jgi:hypothetical protein